MNRDQNTFEKIEGYLNQSLNADERENFERQLEADTELEQEFELHKSLHQELSDTDALEFRKKIIVIAAGLKKKNNKTFIWRYAAMFLVLMGAASFLWLQTETSNDDIFNTYYTVYPVEDVIRGDNEIKKNQIAKYYSEENYEKVIPELNEFCSKNPNNQLFKVYLGNALLQTGQFEKAVIVFQSVKNDNINYENALWYSALSYVKLNKLSQASGILENLITYDGVHKKNAEALLKELNL